MTDDYWLVITKKQLNNIFDKFEGDWNKIEGIAAEIHDKAVKVEFGAFKRLLK